jgi:hypothetical protein
VHLAGTVIVQRTVNTPRAGGVGTQSRTERLDLRRAQKHIIINSDEMPRIVLLRNLIPDGARARSVLIDNADAGTLDPQPVSDLQVGVVIGDDDVSDGRRSEQHADERSDILRPLVRQNDRREVTISRGWLLAMTPTQT